jgi:chromosome segregation ATPase
MTRRIQRKYMDSLRDRGTFEAERDRAQKQAEDAKSKEDTLRTTNNKLKDEIGSLNEQLKQTREMLASSSNPDLARAGQATLALVDSEKKCEALEKRLENEKASSEYTRTAYQDASTRASELSRENGELKERVAELEKRSSTNLQRIHEINAHRQQRAQEQARRDLASQLAERERELDRAREEVKALRNGRRETRQQSVPRSPRMGVLSPRPGIRGGQPSSRGTSPGADSGATGLQFFGNLGQTGMGRWGHLKD